SSFSTHALQDGVDKELPLAREEGFVKRELGGWILGRMIAEMDQDDAVVLKDDKEEDKEVADAVKDIEEARLMRVLKIRRGKQNPRLKYIRLIWIIDW
nr:hypothetical protein [Tanacetum cinerariifolium]